jgi:hypothetical protein
MPFPKTRDELVHAGYVFSEHSICRGATCKQEIEWWLTPRGRRMPFDLMQDGAARPVAHFTTCRDAEFFRK